MSDQKELAPGPESLPVAATPLEQLVSNPTALAELDVDKVRELLAMRNEEIARQARLAFFDALARFQVDCPPLTKIKEGQHKNTHYAPLPHIDRIVTPVLRDHGLTKRFEFEQGNNSLTVTCVLSHRDGHSERTSINLPVDKGPGRSDIQATGSTATYGQRYTLVGALGLATVDEDTDGAQAAPETISEEQLQTLRAILMKCPEDTEQKFIKAAKITDLMNLPAERFEQAKRSISKKLPKREPPAPPSDSNAEWIEDYGDGK